MKQENRVKIIYAADDRWDELYLVENGLYIRDVVLDIGLGQEVVIGHLSDLHYNYCDQQDLDEADPVLMSTLKNRRWLANAESVPVAARCLAFLQDTDQIVINGDTLDYLSRGALTLMQREIWEKYPDIIATVGGHELARKMQ